MTIADLEANAEALDKVASIADYLAGLAAEEPDNAARITGEAQVLRSWAELCRAVSAANG